MAGEGGAGDVEDALEFPALAAALLGARRCDRGVPLRGIEAFFAKPFFGRDEQLGIEAAQRREVGFAARFEIFFFVETGGVFLGEKRGRAFRELRRRERRLDRIVIARRHGIELVIVATRALQRLGEEGLADAVGDIVEEALARDLGDFHAREFPRTHAEKTGGNDRLGIFRIEFVAGDLFAGKTVVGQIGVEGAHDVVAVTPGVAALEVVGEPAAVGVAHDVEPVLRHALAVVWAGEEAVDEMGDRRWRIGD